MQRFRASSLFQPSNLNAAVGAHSSDTECNERPEHLFGAMLGIPHTQMARVVAVLGFDFIFVDTVHVPTNPETLASLIQTINFCSEGKTCAIVRVSGPDSDMLAYALDAGAAGIVFPQIDTAAQAEAAVKKVRHAYNGGERSISPIALLDGITTNAPAGWTPETVADRNIAVICQVESALAIENVDSIAKVPGVNVLMVGVRDLKATLDLPVRNPDRRVDESKFYDAIAKVVATSDEYGIPLMIPTFKLNPEDMGWLQKFRMILTSVDVSAVQKSHQRDLAQFKEAMGVSQKAPNGLNGHPNGQKVPNGLNGHQKLSNGINGHQNGYHEDV